MNSQMRGKGTEGHCKELMRLLDHLSISFCLGIMSVLCFRFLPQRRARFRFRCIIMILKRSNSSFKSLLLAFVKFS